MSASKKASVLSDEGAFSSLPGYTPEALRDKIRGQEFLATRTLLKRRRDSDEWTGPFLLGIHRDIFGRFFPTSAGRYRIVETNYGDKAAPPPEQLDTLLRNLVFDIGSHLRDVQAETQWERRIDLAFSYAALDHAEMIRIHPFIDGNGRWARIATNAFLFDAGFRVGTILRKANKRKYIEALDRCMEHREPGDLVACLLMGYIDMLRKH